MTNKQKGTKVERDLLKLLWDNGFAAARVAGSGSNPLPAPDIIFGKGWVIYAGEIKSAKSLPVYLEREQVEELELFCGKAIFIPLIIWKQNYKKFKYISPQNLKESKSGEWYIINKEVEKISCYIEDLWSSGCSGTSFLTYGRTIEWR